jgi:hypothetical protein
MEKKEIKKVVDNMINNIEFEEHCKKKNIPLKMPYTIKDIENCKDIDQDKVFKDFRNLIDFKADTNPKKFCGNKTLYNYQFKNLLKCKRENGKTLYEIFDNDVLKEKLWQDSVKRNRRDKAPYPSPTDVYEANRINTGAIVFFKASTSKYIYKKYNAKSVLDFTMGWGGRMLGAMALDIKYTGIDTNTNLKEGYEKMIDDIYCDADVCIGDKEGIDNINLIWENCLNIDYSGMDYDLILTSPPYINMELYENMTPFESDNKYYNEFLMPIMDRTFKYLKSGGRMCINISPKIYKELTTKYGYRECDETEDLRQQMGKNYVVKSKDLIYIWKKEDELQLLKEQLSVAEDGGKIAVNILKEEIIELKKENEELKEKIFDLENLDSKIADERLDEIIKLESRIKELEDEKPYEELYKLEKLKEENEKLKEENDKHDEELQHDHEVYKDIIDQHEQYIKKLEFINDLNEISAKNK